jgi:AcrR family transcriptional regulator
MPKHDIRLQTHAVTRIRPDAPRQALAPRKQPSQPRGKVTAGIILEAAARILEENKTLTTNTVAERAGVSIGTLYQYFASKEAVLAALSRQTRAALVRDLTAAAVTARSLPLREGLRQMVAAAFTADAARPRLAAMLDRAEAALPLEDDETAIGRELRKQISKYLHHYFPDTPMATLDVLADDLRAVTSALAEAARHRGEVVDYNLIDRMTRSLFAMVSSRSTK